MWWTVIAALGAATTCANLRGSFDAAGCCEGDSLPASCPHTCFEDLMCAHNLTLPPPPYGAASSCLMPRRAIDVQMPVTIRGQALDFLPCLTHWGTQGRFGNRSDCESFFGQTICFDRVSWTDDDGVRGTVTCSGSNSEPECTECRIISLGGNLLYEDNITIAPECPFIAEFGSLYIQGLKEINLTNCQSAQKLYEG